MNLRCQRRLTLASVLLMASILGQSSSHAAPAEPIAGATIDGGEGLGEESGWHMGVRLFVLPRLGQDWFIGGEVGGTFESFLGGYGCGQASDDPKVSVPSIAVVCMQPSLAAHALLGKRFRITEGLALGAQAGMGGAALFWLPGQGGRRRIDLRPSFLLRAKSLVRVATGPNAEWWIGLALEERALGFLEPRMIRSVGVIVEGHSF